MHDPADPLQSQYFRVFAAAVKLVPCECYATGPLTVRDETRIDRGAVLLKNVLKPKNLINGDT